MKKFGATEKYPDNGQQSARFRPVARTTHFQKFFIGRVEFIFRAWNSL
jgi:hypothetical protein